MHVEQLELQIADQRDPADQARLRRRFDMRGQPHDIDDIIDGIKRMNAAIGEVQQLGEGGLGTCRKADHGTAFAIDAQPHLACRHGEPGAVDILDPLDRGQRDQPQLAA